MYILWPVRRPVYCFLFIIAAQCGSDPNWYFYNDHCYLLPPPSGVNATLNWYDANTYCNDRNSHLTSIHSIEENFFLNGIVSTCFVLNKSK